VTCRHTPSGYLRSTYSAAEVDAIAVYAPTVDESYLIPIWEVEGHRTISLRLTATGNNQAVGVRWARDYELAASLLRNWSTDEKPSPEIEASSERALG
jgi:hypothetical protein